MPEDLETLKQKVENELKGVRLEDVDVEERSEANVEDICEAEDELEDLRAMNKMYKPFRDKLAMDQRSVRTTSTMSTIAPEEIKKRVKLAITKKERIQKAKKVKANASNVNRGRRDNKHEIKASVSAVWDD